MIVKARQLWFSTAIQIDFFDDFLFNRNYNIGIIAHEQDSATAIFRDKIKVARDNLPEWLKRYYKIKTERVNEISIENTWSIIRVATSFRGWTLQRLHVSEYGKVCASYPEKALEIKTWALEAVWKGNIVTIESTAMWGEWEFYEIAKKAKDIQDSWRIPNDLEYKLFFYPWRKELNYRTDSEIMITQDVREYFDTLREKNNLDLEEWQKKRYAMKYSNLWETMLREYPSTFEEAFNLTIKWAYYEREITTLRMQRRVCNVSYDTQLQVHTARDLWWAWWWDDTAIRFFQLYGNEIRVIDFREWNGRSLIEILETIIKSKSYQYWKFYWPHDMNVTEFSTGTTRRMTAKQHWYTFDIIGRLSISEWINQVRQMFPRMWFDEQKTTKGIQLLSRYRRSWDETNSCWRDRPEHNWASHCADAIRYMCSWISLVHWKEDKADITTLKWNI